MPNFFKTPYWHRLLQPYPEAATSKLFVLFRMQSANCLNCEALLPEAARFCHQCGQKASLHRLSWHDVAHDAVHYFTHADKGIFSLIKALALRTGNVAREYVQGRRKRYFPPLNFFLLVAALFVFMTNVFERFTPTNAAAQQAQIEKMKDPKKKEMLRRMYQRQGKAVQFVGKYSNFISMAATPLIAAIIWLFYKKGTYNYIEHLIANLYATGFTTLVYALLIIPLAYAAGIKGTSLSIAVVYFIFEIVYRSVFYYRFINKGTRASAIKATAASFTAILFWFLLSSTLIGWYMMAGTRFT